jgi:hypothetical protein
MYLVFINLVTPKARAKHEPFVQQTGLCLAAALGVTKFTTIIAMHLVTLCCAT